MNKTDITPSLVRCLLADQFPQWAGLPVRAVVPDGWDNRTFRVGDALSARLPSADAYVAQVEKEHRWLPILADQLPLAIPSPVAQGVPGCGYPRPWSIYQWLMGQPATSDRIDDLTEFAVSLAGFLAALYSIDSRTGPLPGQHNFFRGGSLATYDNEARAAIDQLAGDIDSEAATRVWEIALLSSWNSPPVWVHGDVTPSNLLVRDGRLSAVIDFGSTAVGDPACDTVVAWTLLHGSSRAAFRSQLPLDGATWTRGRGWALWKALITHLEAHRRSPGAADLAGLNFGWRHNALAVVEDLIAEHSTGA